MDTQEKPSIEKPPSVKSILISVIHRHPSIIIPHLYAWFPDSPFTRWSNWLPTSKLHKARVLSHSPFVSMSCWVVAIPCWAVSPSRGSRGILPHPSPAHPSPGPSVIVRPWIFNKRVRMGKAHPFLSITLCKERKFCACYHERYWPESWPFHLKSEAMLELYTHG